MANEQEQIKLQNTRRQRVRTQQGIISVFSILCLLFSCVWGVHAASSKTVFFEPSDDSSQAEAAEAKKKNVKQTDSSSKAEEESSEAAESQVSHDEGDDLSDAVFIGDSRTVGLENTCPYPKATFYCYVGMHIDNATTDPAFTLSNGNMGTVIDALSEGTQYGRIYINLGTNELGWPYIENFQEYYRDLIEQIKAVQPNATIYAESILPVTASRELEGDDINNTNVTRFNEAIQQVCTETGAVYLNCLEAVADENGYLPEEASTDGIHLLADYCDLWLQYIIDNT